MISTPTAYQSDQTIDKKYTDPGPDSVASYGKIQATSSNIHN